MSGGLAQMVQRSLIMWEVLGSIPEFSKKCHLKKDFGNTVGANHPFHNEAI